MDRLIPLHLPTFCATLNQNSLGYEDQVLMTSPGRIQETTATISQSQSAGERGRRYGLRDGACQAVTQGSGEQYLSAFALLLHASPFQLSILSALPQLIGTGAQLVSVKLLQWFPNRKALISSGTVGQAVTWIPIVLLPLLIPQWGPWLVVCGAAAYFACAHFTAPAWNSLIADWLDQHERGAYFARRAQIIAGLSFFSLCGAGWTLSVWQDSSTAWWGFVLIFALAGGARILSVLALSPVQDIHPTAHQEAQQGFRGFFRLSATKDFRCFLLFSGLMHASVLIAGPFFVLYMLQDLHLSYIGYGGWLAAGLLGQLLTLQAWGQFGDRFGNKALLSCTGFTVPILPMLYLVSTDLGFLLAVNFLGGVIWAGLALGLQNYVFDSVRPEERAKAIALYSTVNAVGWSVGALLGSWLVESLPVRIEWAGVILQPASNLPFVFFLSGVLRLLVSFSLLGTFHETRQVERVPRQQLLWELPLVKPVARFAVWTLSKSTR
ncbi:MAG TPA: MFS transporter [Nitrospiraceae bacterium]|nr:MFS transporter [Nitrospiraceae bacterium]